MHILSHFSRIILKIWGWKISGNDLKNIDKYIAIVAPHTSSWDFILGLLLRSALRLDIRFIGKHTLFKKPFGFLFYFLGGYPVDRSKSNNLVDTIVQIYNDHEKFALCIAPEGTRSKVAKFKTGFYHIAHQAKIPIVMISFDFSGKEIFLGDPFYPTGDFEDDMEKIYAFFKGAKGKHPAKGIDL